MCEKCKMEMKNTEKNTHKNDETVSREITMMVGVAHKMTSDFNQMVEYRIKKCVRQNIHFLSHSYAHKGTHWSRDIWKTEKKTSKNLKGILYIEIIDKK